MRGLIRTAAAAAWGLLLAFEPATAFSQERPWYFRVDTGYAWGQPSDFRDRNAFPPLICAPLCAAPAAIDHVGRSPVFGGGIGWRFSPQLRADLTLSQRKFAVDGMDGTSATFHGDVNSRVTMLTGYWDIPYEGRFKPYVGAGVGMARNTMGITTAWVGVPFPLEVAGGVNTSTAYSLSAGVSFEVTKGAILEVGYRYFDLGKFQTGNTVGVFGVFTAPYGGAQGNLRTNELTLGLRF